MPSEKRMESAGGGSQAGGKSVPFLRFRRRDLVEGAIFRASGVEAADGERAHHRDLFGQKKDLPIDCSLRETRAETELLTLVVWFSRFMGIEDLGDPRTRNVTVFQFGGSGQAGGVVGKKPAN